MKLTVGANIVVKWFVSETLSDDARLLLARRIHLHAPDLVLSEYANVIWKKARRNDISDAEPYLGEIPGLPDVISLFPDRDLVMRASQFATGIDHPIYDCLYLACAEATGSDLVTADNRLANKWARVESPRFQVLSLGDPGVRLCIVAAAFAPVIGHRQIEELADAFDVLEKTEKHVLDKLFAGTQAPRIITDKNWEPILNSPSYRRVIDAIRELSEDAYIDLLALGWLGEGYFSDWPRSVAHAEDMALANGFDPNYVAGYGHHWRIGFKRMVEDRQKTETASHQSC